MTAAQLHAALIVLPITEDRLRKASRRADSPNVYAQVLEQLAAEGRWPIERVNVDLSQHKAVMFDWATVPSFTPREARQADSKAQRVESAALTERVQPASPDELPEGLSYDPAWPLGAVLKVGGHDAAVQVAKKATARKKTKKASASVGKKKRPKGY